MPATGAAWSLSRLLSEAGFVAADEEAAELLDRAAGDGDLLASFGSASAERRTSGLDHRQCPLRRRADRGRSRRLRAPVGRSMALARRAVERLPADGVAVDLCTGTGAIARTLMAGRPGARVVATEIDPESGGPAPPATGSRSTKATCSARCRGLEGRGRRRGERRPLCTDTRPWPCSP